MEIKNLASTDLETIIGCLSQSFADYFVPMSADIGYWRNRLKISRVDLHYSYGCFDEERLVGFMLIAIDQHEGWKTAYNGGTGVIPDYRGRKIVDQLYQFAIPRFKQNAIEICTLEVIEQNDRAINVYERIGFKKTKFLRCFKGNPDHNKADMHLKEISMDEISHPDIQDSQMPAWDHTLGAIKLAGDIYTVFEVINSNEEKLGFFVINPENGYIAQAGLYPGITGEENWIALMNAITKICSAIKMNNVDDRRQELIAAVEQAGLDNFINQFEMEFFI